MIDEGRALSLTPSEIRYVRKAAAVRERLSNVALAERFRMTPRTIARYIRGEQKKLKLMGRT